MRTQKNKLQSTRRWVLQPLEVRTAPATFAVTNTTDALTPGTLRRAVADANITPGIDTVVFDFALFSAPQTITLTLGEIVVADAVSIIGTTADNCIVSGGKTDRIFNTESAPIGSSIDVSNLTLTLGLTTDRGGAITAGDENLMLTGCQLTSNHTTNPFGTGGGAIYMSAFGSLIANFCTFSNNVSATSGGAIYSLAGVLLVNSVVSDNQAMNGKGGGVLINGDAGFSTTFVRNSTLSTNKSGSDGGGIALVSFNGGLNIQNSTITANAAGGNGGGIAGGPGSAIISVESTIVSDNNAAAGPDISSLGTVNVNYSAVGSSAGFTLTGANNLPFAASLMLGPLANNGGPTRTHSLSPASPCINAGSNPTGTTIDQRGPGFARTVNGKVDIGAFESQVIPTKVAFVQINGGAAQRSRVTSLLVTFNQSPTLPTMPSNAFRLMRQSDSALVALSAVPSGNTVQLTFTGGPVEFGSLADGRYTLTALASQIANFDGDGNGVTGDDYVLVGHPATNMLFRLFGDSDGDGTMAANDFIQFRLAFGGSNPIFDFDGDGAVAASDFIQFRLRFGASA